MASIQPYYSKEQQIYSLSHTINVAFGNENYSTLPELTAYVKESILTVFSDPVCQQLIGKDWSLEWGPVVSESLIHPAGKAIADNTMALLYSPGQQLLVVAIAGTNSVSVYDWLFEDFNVLLSTVCWSEVINNPSVSPEVGISRGTHDGLQALLAMRDTDGRSLFQAIATKIAEIGAAQGAVAELAVCGHSLGGALSPTMALYIRDTFSSWQQPQAANGLATISAWPTAGPTPGNQGFVSYYQQALNSSGKDSIAFKFTSKYSSLDIVPHAWAYANLKNVPGIYVPYISKSYLLEFAIFLIKGRISEYATIESWAPIEGSFNSELDKQITDAHSCAHFVAQTIYQHTDAYNSLLEIEAFTGQFASLIKQAPTDFVALAEEICSHLELKFHSMYTEHAQQTQQVANQ